MTHLNDLSKAYLDQIAEKKKDDTYLEPDMKKRQANNEKARKDMKKMGSMSNPHFGSGPTGSMSSEALDPVGKEDGDVNNDGKKDSSDSYLMKRRKAIAKAMKKESFVTSDWRHEISEVMTDIESEPIKEKKVKNKVTINPTMGEAVEEIGGTLIEEIEVDDIEGVIECVYGELIEEGYTEDEVESAIEQALTEAEVTMGHDSYGPQKTEPKAERTRDKLKKKAKGFLGKVAVKAYNKAREAKVAATPAVQRAKTSAKRGIRKMALKVADKLKEENVDEAVYGGTPPEKKDTRMVVTNADKKANTPAYQKMKAGDKRYKAADHMNEGDGDPCWDSHKQVGMKKKGNRMVPNCVPKNEEVEVSEEGSMSAQEIALQKRKSTIDQMIARKRRQELDQGKKEKPTKAMGEETEDSLRDRRMERGGVDGNNRYDRAPGKPNTFGKKKPKYDGMSALEKVKADIRAKHGKGAIKEDAKMAKQSDEKLAALHKQVSSSDQSLPSNQFMMKRVTKEMNRRKKAT